MGASQKTVVTTEVGPAELAAGVVYVHDYELDGDERLDIGHRVEIRDGGGDVLAATVVERWGARWKLALGP